MGDNFTLFKSGSGSGSGGNSSDYVKDAFQDLSLPANTNTGLSSTVSTNPNGYYFKNDDTPRYLIKTLFIKDLVLVEDRTKWINNQITYEVIWNETCPAVKGYIVGTARLRNFKNGKCVEITNIDNIFGVTGVIRQVAWLVNATSITGTADLVTDGVDTGNDITFGGAAVQNQFNGLNELNALLHNSVKSSQNIHDYRLVANETASLNVSGVVCYFENATNNLDCFPGSTYVDKSKETTSNIVGVTLPVMSGRVGGKTVIYKTSAGYALETEEPTNPETIGQGTSGTALVNVTTGHGASFPIGTVVGAIASGSSYYLGMVTNQSTDTLTVIPDLPFGLSGPLFKTHLVGSTQVINQDLYELSKSIDLNLQNNSYDQSGFGIGLSGDYYYSEPTGKYRVWGDGLQINNVYGTPGVQFSGATAGFLQIDGNFSAAEIELMGVGINNHAVYVNGLSAFVLNSGITGSLKQTIFTDAGPGRNSIVIAPGSSLSGTVITNINLYEMRTPIGITTGQLAQFDTFMNRIPRAAANATIMDLGSAQRVYADQMYFSGAWTRGATHTVSGGIFYQGLSSNSALKFQYYGTDFALVGTIGNSTICTLDGASINSSFGAFKSATLGFHSVVVTNQGTSGPILSALDYIRPSVGEVLSLQNFLPVPEVEEIPRVYTQSDTPRIARDGDIWVQQFTNDQAKTKSWIQLGGKWNLLQFTLSLDDPNTVIAVRSHGGSTGDTPTNGQANLEMFNFVSWSTGPLDTVLRIKLQNGDSIYSNAHHVLDGQFTDSNIVAAHRIFDKVSWSTGTNRSTARCGGGIGNLNGVLIIAGGSTGGSASTATTVIDTFNGTAFSAAVANLGTGTSQPSAFVQGGKIRIVNGDNGGGVVDAHQTYNNVAASTDTAIGTASYGGGGSASPGLQGLALAGVNNSTPTCSRVWSGTAWGLNIATPHVYADYSNNTNVGPVSFYNPTSSQAYINGGTSAVTTSITTTARFNGTAWVSDSGSASSTARAGAMGGVL